MKRIRQILAAGSMLIACTALIHAQPALVKDHPLVSRFAGSAVAESSVTEFDEYPLVTGPNRKGKFTKIDKVEGKITHFKYTLPANHTPLEIMRSYENALRQGGFQVLFSCTAAECGDAMHTDELRRWIGMWCNDCGDPAMRYLAAKLPRPAGDVYVAVKITQNSCWGCGPIDGTFLNIIETKPIETGQVTVNAEALANDVARTGHAAVYGIYFDTGTSTLKPESDPTLAEIAKLLASNLQMKLHVVGNTDNVGGLAANMALSKQRAEAVVAALANRFHADPLRLQAAGVGPLAPVDSNRAEEGRARNRRVDLVEQ